MRLIKPDPKSFNELVKEATHKLLSGKSSVTLSIDSLLKLDKPKEEDRPTVIITEEANAKMKALVASTNKEVAWHGLVTRPQPLEFHITDILVYPQKVTGTTVESDDDLYPEWLNNLTDEQYNQLRMQGHSHVNMSVFSSGTDSDFYETLTKHMTDYYIFIILNKSNKIYMEVRDIKNNMLYETADIDIYYEGEDYAEWAEEQLDKHVVAKTYKYKSKNKSNKIKTIPQDDETQYDDLEYDYEDEEWEQYFNYINYINGRNIL